MVYVGFFTPACLVSFAYFILRVVVSEFPPNTVYQCSPNKCKAPEKSKQSPTHPYCVSMASELIYKEIM